MNDDEDPPRPPSPHWRRRLHHTAHPRASAPLSRRAPRLRRRAVSRAGPSAATRISTSVIVAPRRRGAAASARRPRARTPAAARALRHRHRSPWRPARGVADVGQRRADAHRLRHAGRSWIYTHRVPRSPDLFPRHSVLNQWDLLAPLGIDDCTPERDPVEMAEDAARRRSASTRRLERGWHPRGPSTGGRARERRQPVPPLAGRVVRVDDRRRWPSAIPRRRIIVASGPSDARRGPAGHRGGPREALDAGRAAAARSTGTSASFARSSPARRCTLGATAARCTWRRRPGRRSSRCSGRRCPSGPARGGIRSCGAEIVDAGPLPCRPCDQRRCVPGDFRCLTRISPEQVLAAVERVLR